MRMTALVIVTNARGTSELRNDGYNGALFQEGDYVRIAQYMIKTYLGKWE